MAQPLVYVDTSRVREGALVQVKTAIEELAGFVEEKELQLISYGAYLTEDGAHMSVVHIHRDPASLDYHMDVAAPLFAGFAGLVTLTSIHIYGRPSEKAVEQLRAKLRLLGSGELVVHAPAAGFARFAGVPHLSSDRRTEEVGA